MQSLVCAVLETVLKPVLFLLFSTPLPTVLKPVLFLLDGSDVSPTKKKKTSVSRTESHQARFNSARAMFEKMGSADDLVSYYYL